MKRRALLLGTAVGFTSILSRAASAHVRHEYLQATTVDLAREVVTLRLRLTPGTDVATAVLALIDTDGDGHISNDEKQAYATRVSSDLALAVDGVALPLQVAGFDFPAVDTFADGHAFIAMLLQAPMPVAAGRHRLVLVNRHGAAFGGYQVNCLLPQDPAIRVLGQQRSADQTSYSLDFEIVGIKNTSDAKERQEQDAGLSLFLATPLLMTAIGSPSWRATSMAGTPRGVVSKRFADPSDLSAQC